MGEERCQVVSQEVPELMAAQFVRKIDYSTWHSNVVMVKKPNKKWRMCVDYTNLNQACPMDAYLPGQWSNWTHDVEFSKCIFRLQADKDGS